MAFVQELVAGHVLPAVTHTRLNLREWLIGTFACHLSWAINGYNGPDLDFVRKLDGVPIGILRQMLLMAMQSGKLNNDDGMHSVWIMRIFALQSAIRWRLTPRCSHHSPQTMARRHLMGKHGEEADPSDHRWVRALFHLLR
jgi:hypothetical protein